MEYRSVLIRYPLPVVGWAFDNMKILFWRSITLRRSDDSGAQDSAKVPGVRIGMRVPRGRERLLLDSPVQKLRVRQRWRRNPFGPLPARAARLGGVDIRARSGEVDVMV